MSKLEQEMSKLEQENKSVLDSSFLLETRLSELMVEKHSVEVTLTLTLTVTLLRRV